jgi:3'(2'), 5'-bisphosphate nucleotidase
MTNQDQRLHAAISAVQAACRVARHVQSQLDRIQQLAKDDKSPVTVADFAAQAVVARRLAEELGEILLVGEESSGALRSGEQNPLRTAVVEAVRLVWSSANEEDVLRAIDAGGHDASAAAYWTLDPIDGTKGFVRGGQYAIALAYIERGEVTLGVMGCPNLSADFQRPFSVPDPDGRIYFATRGGGAWELSCTASSDETRRLDPSPPEAGALIRVCESVEAGHSQQDQTAQVIAMLGGAGTPARLDSQCKYAVVARGQADAYLRLPTRADYIENIWDHAAGMIIATEAGMVVTDIDGRPLDFSRGAGLTRNRGIVCASPSFHGRIVEAVGHLP